MSEQLLAHSLIDLLRLKPSLPRLAQKTYLCPAKN